MTTLKYKWPEDKKYIDCLSILVVRLSSISNQRTYSEWFRTDSNIKVSMYEFNRFARDMFDVTGKQLVHILLAGRYPRMDRLHALMHYRRIAKNSVSQAKIYKLVAEVNPEITEQHYKLLPFAAVMRNNKTAIGTIRNKRFNVTYVETAKIHPHLRDIFHDTVHAFEGHVISQFDEQLEMALKRLAL